MSDVLRIEREGHVATLWLARPDRRNAMGTAFWRDLPDVVAELEDDDAVRAVVLAAEGAHFSTGLDLMEMGGELGPLLAGGLSAERRRLFRKIVAMRAGLDAIARSDKAWVAAVQGACIGGGVDLIACCDVRVASTDARFSVRETKIAIVADMGSLQRLEGIVGAGHLRELALTGRDIDAERALRIGLVNDLYPDRAAALAAARALATEIADNSPIAVSGTKRALRFARKHGEEASLEYVAALNSAELPSEDLQEAMAAVLSKRKPSFRGR
jgi:enoyl-CoA hydratase